MSSTLINTSLSSLSSGVSQQYQEGRYDSQVSEMVNCIPSITRGVIRRNPLQSISQFKDNNDNVLDLKDAYVYSYDRGTSNEQYIVVVLGNGSMYVYNVNYSSSSPIYYTEGQDYLTIAAPNTAKHSFKALTIGDHTFIINTTITTQFTDDVISNDGYDDMAFYWIKKTASVTTNQYQDTDGNTGTLQLGYEYILNNLKISAMSDTRPNQTQISLNTSIKIAEQFSLHPLESKANKYDGSIVYSDYFKGTDWNWSDTYGNEASLGIWKIVDDSADLPATLPKDLDGFVTQVSGGTSATFDDYYLSYSYEEKRWKEVVRPGAKYKIDPTTMPHVLYRLTSGFIFNTYKEVSEDRAYLKEDSLWIDRQSGGSEETEDPSFLGSTLNDIFFHKNRLGFLTADSVVLSQTGDYGNFFVQSIQQLQDDDPIDLSVASTDVTILRHAVSTSGQLILFSNDTQFSLVSLDGALTTSSADIVALSNYTYGSNCPAKAIGNKVYFTNQAGGYSQVYSYQITDRGSKITEANPMTIHLPTYISSSTSRIIGHDVLGFTFIEEEEKPKELIVLSSVIKGKEDLQNAFHKWEFIKDIASTHIIKNSLYILFTDGSLTKMPLDIPGSISDVYYVDKYNEVDNNNMYSSYIEFSKFYIRDSKGKGTSRGRYQIRTIKYTVNSESEYVTTIYNEDLIGTKIEGIFGPTWEDTTIWVDGVIWNDINPAYYRKYVNDDNVVVMANNDKVSIVFSNNSDEPTKGFELATCNIEGLFHQRSTRAKY